ncbi:MAG TPA: M28 family peptidase [Solirubrobacteraceae bacterium]|nr:M28 family peptidase [Solirubrobacteraceae bacterium]
MSTVDTVAGLAAFPGRGAGTDAERRAARWLCDQLDADGREARLEPFWCRPSWALASLWHVALGLIGSLVAVSSARVGGALVLVALLSTIADALTGRSPGRLLTPERASQNVVSETGDQGRRVRLIITANYDAGRTGLVYRSALRRPAARLRQAIGGATPGWAGWITIALAWLLAVAIARVGGSKGSVIGVLQLLPTVALVLGLALLAELASSNYGPAAGDNGSGVAAALALTRALDAGPPRNAAVELVLAGAGDGLPVGFRRYLRARRGSLKATNTVVLGIAPCAAGQLRWWVSDGPLVPRRYFARLRELAGQIAHDEPFLRAAPHLGRGASPAQPARAAGLPAITIGRLDEHGLAPNSGTSADTAEHVDAGAIDTTVQFGLMLVDAIDAYLGQMPATGDATAPTARRRLFKPV